MNELVKQQTAFEKRLDEINDLKVTAEEFKLEAVSKYDIYVEEIETRLGYITKLEEESAIEQEERRIHRRIKEMQAQMREEFQMREEATADNVNLQSFQSCLLLCLIGLILTCSLCQNFLTKKSWFPPNFVTHRWASLYN